MRRLTTAAASLLLAFAFATAASAQTPRELREKMNAGTVTVVSGRTGGTYIRIAADIATVVDDEEDVVRVLPIISDGGASNIRDILYLRGVDMGIIRSDAIEAFNGKPGYGDLSRSLRYITKLYNEEMHIVGRPGIETLEDLRDKTVNFLQLGSGTNITAQLIFEKLGIEVNRVNMGSLDAIEAMKNGEIDATIHVAGKPVGWIAREELPSGFKLIPIPATPALLGTHVPTKLTHDDYPNLIAEGQTVETIAASAVLAAYNWQPGTPQYRRLERFTKRFLDRLPEFRKPPRHPKWAEVNPAALLEGWRKFAPVQEWLDARPQEAAAPATNEDDALRAKFEAFLAGQRGDGGNANTNADELFSRFLEWNAANQ